MENYNPAKKRKMLVLFDDMIADMKGNRKLSPADSYYHGTVLNRNISLVFISQSHFKVPKTIRLNTTHCFIMKIYKKI